MSYTGPFTRKILRRVGPEFNRYLQEIALDKERARNTGEVFIIRNWPIAKGRPPDGRGNRHHLSVGRSARPASSEGSWVRELQWRGIVKRPARRRQ
jgi:hypothetical protein